jgi:hypothetical protein
MMHKYVFAAILRGNETKSFGIAKPFYCTSTHKYSTTQKNREKPGETPRILLFILWIRIKEEQQIFRLISHLRESIFSLIAESTFNEKGSMLLSA